MSTIFQKEFKKIRRWPHTAQRDLHFPQEERCSLCAGELYPGDPYFELDGRAVCEDCLGRYARRYFAAQLRRVGRGRGRNRNTVF